MRKRIFAKDTYVYWVLGLTYLVTRLVNILVLPLFTDESIYIYWAKVIATTHSQFFISLTDGKPPLLIWMISVLLSIFPNDWYLLAGRLPSVFTGLVALFGIVQIGRLLYTKRVGVIAGILYIICPMTLFYDRMALFDSMLSAMLVLSVYFALRTGKTKKLIDAVVWGGFLGLAFLSKPTALLFLPLTVLAACLMLSKEKLLPEAKRLAPLAILAVIIGEGINSLQRISSAYPAMIRKNQQFQQPISELLANPFALTLGNLKGLMSWTIDYYTLPFFVFGVGLMVVGMIKKPRETLILLMLWALPLVLLATVGREIFPRYILIVVPYFLLIVAFGIDYLLTFKGVVRYAIILGLVVLSLPLLRFDWYLLTDPSRAPLPESEANQYVLEHPAGYGLEAVYGFLRDASAKKPITVVTQGTFGLYPYAFYLEFWGNPSINVLPKWPLETLDDEIYAAQKKRTVYVILKEYDAVPTTLPLEEVFRAVKPGGKDPIIVTKIKTP